MDRTKIAFIITLLELGGAQKSVLYSAQNLDKSGFEPYLLTGPGGYFDAYAKEHIKNLFFINNLQRMVNPIKDIKAIFEIKNALLNIKPDVVHTNSSKAGIAGRLAAVLARRKVKNLKIVHTVHGFGFNDSQNAFKRNFFILLERLFARVTDALIFVSVPDVETALKLKIAPPKKCHIIRAGIELKTKEDFKNLDKQAKRKSLGLEANNKVVICVANLKPQKNPVDMLKAAKIVTGQEPKAVFLYLGTGELEPKVKAIIDSAGLKNNFKLLGHRDDVQELLAISDVFALSSLWEGLPMAMVEALSMGVPAVCYDTGGIAELLEDGGNGFIIQRGNFHSLAEKILQILKGPFTFKQGTINLQEFDIKEMVRKQQNLYQTLTRQGE